MTYKGRTIMVDKQYNGGLFDMSKSGTISKVDKFFKTKNDKDIIAFSRMPYHKNDRFQEATLEDIKAYGCFYFDEDGSRPFKEKDCRLCSNRGTCFLKDEDIARYIEDGNE